MKLKRILSTVLSAVVIFNTVASPIVSSASGVNSTDTQTESAQTEKKLTYSEYEDLLDRNFYGTFHEMKDADRKAFIEGLSDEEAYQLNLEAKYYMLYELIEVSLNEEIHKARLESAIEFAEYAAEIAQKAKDAQIDKEVLDKATCKKLSKNYYKELSSFDDFNAYLQSLTSLDVKAILKEMDTFSSADKDNIAEMVTKFQNYVYAVFGFDRQSKNAKAGIAPLAEVQPRALSKVIFKFGDYSTYVPGDYSFNPKFIKGKTTISITGAAPSGYKWTDYSNGEIKNIMSGSNWYKPGSGDNNKYYVTYKNVGTFNGEIVDLRIKLTQFGSGAAGTTTGVRGIGFGQKSIAFGYANFNNNMNANRYITAQLDLFKTGTTTPVPGIKGYMMINDLDYFGGVPESLELISGTSQTIYTDSANSGKVNVNGYRIEANKNIGGDLISDGGNAVYLFNGSSHTVKWRGALNNYDATTTPNVPSFTKYTISYNANGGTGAPASQIKEHGKALTLSKTVPTRKGYNFAGWGSSATATSPVNQPGGTYTGNANYTYYAIWVPYRHNVGFDTQGGNINKVNVDGYLMPDSGWYRLHSALGPYIHVQSMNRNNGAKYVAWAGASETLGDSNNAMYYLERFKDTQYYLIINARSGKYMQLDGNETNVINGSTGGKNTQPYQYNLIWKTNGEPEADFLWSFKKVGNYVSLINKANGLAFDLPNAATANGTVVQMYTPNSSNAQLFTWEPHPTYINPNFHTKYKVADSTFNLPFAIPHKTGYTFVNWNTAADGSGTAYSAGSSLYTHDQDGGKVTMYAQYKPITYNVVYNGNGATGGSTATSTHTYDVAKALTANGFTRPGYAFAGWATSASGAVVYTNGQSVKNLTTVNGATINLYAKWTPTNYTVTYKANGGTGADQTQTTNYGVAWTTKGAAFTKTGYTQTSWNTKADGSGTKYSLNTAQGNWSSTSNLVLYAQYTPITYKVAYNGNGATGGSTATSTHTYDVAKALTANGFTKTGYTFAGWATSATGAVVYTNGQSIKNLTTTNGATVTLYAKWTPITYKVAYNGNGATGGSTATSTHTYDVAKALTANGFTKTGYTFSGWATSASGAVVYTNGQSVKNLTTTNGATVTLYAKWTPITYKVAYNGNGATAGSTTTSTHTYDVAKALTANGFTRTGYTFAGWATSATGAVVYANSASVKNLTTTNGATVTLYAKWTPITYKVAYNGNGATGGSTATSTHTYDVAKALTANGFTKTGYTFSGWATSATGAVVYANSASVKNLTTTNGATVNLYAVWKPNNYTVTYKANGGTGADQTQTTTYNAAWTTKGAVFTKTGYTQTSWNTAADGSGTKYSLNTAQGTWTRTSNLVLYAQYTPNTYKVVYNGNGSTGGSTATSTHTYDVAKNLTSNGFTRTGYTFAGWATSAGGTVVYTNGQSVKNLTTVNGGTVNLYAVWTINGYNLTINPNGGLYGGVSSSQVFKQNYGTTKTISVPTRTGYTFNGWLLTGYGTLNNVATPDPTFKTSTGKVGVYNNTGNGNVVHTRQAAQADNPTDSNYEIKIQVNGTASLGNGGFYQSVTSSASKTYIHSFIAKVPVGYTLNIAHNAVGTGYTQRWLTSNVGTGKWETYAYELKSGATGSFSTFGHVYVSGGTAPFTWYLASSQITTVSGATTTYTYGAGNGTLTAQWTPNQYAVTYKANGGTGADQTQGTTYGAAWTTKGAVFTKTGYTQTSWNTAADGSGTKYSLATAQSAWARTSNLVLYAQYTPNTYTVVYNGNGSTGGSTATSTHTYDVAKALTANGFTRTGHTFAGWATSATGAVVYTNGQSVKNLTTVNGATVNLYAVWTPNKYTVTYSANGGTGTMAADTVTYDANYTTKANAFTRTGYTFVGWNEKADGTGTDWTAWIGKPWKWTYTKNITLYAQWKINTYDNNISHWLNGFKNQDGNNAAKTAYRIADTQFNAVYNSSYTMDKDRAVKVPNGCYLGTNFAITNVSANKEYHPLGTTVKQLAQSMRFEYDYFPTKYKITYDLDGGTNSSKNPGTYDVLYGVTLDKPTKPGYTFDGWFTSDGKQVTGINEGQNATFSSPSDMYTKLDKRQTGDVTLTAKWHPNEITVHYNGNGGSVDSAKTRAVSTVVDDTVTWEKAENYLIQKNKTFSKFERDGYAFAGWGVKSTDSPKDKSKLYVDSKDSYVDIRKGGFEPANLGISTFAVTPDDDRNRNLYAIWDKAPTIKVPVNPKETYEGLTVTREQLLKDVTATDKEDGTLTNQIKIIKIEYSAGKLAGGVKQPAYSKTWSGGMPVDETLDTWFMQMDKNDSPVTHKITYQVTDSAGNVTTAVGSILVKYNNFPEITAEDRYFTLEEAQAGMITDQVLRADAIANGDLKSKDEEEDSSGRTFPSKVTLLDFDPEEFKNFTESGYRKLTFHVQDSYGPGGKGKETTRQITVFVVKDGEIPEVETAKEVRFISEKYYDRNKDCDVNTMTDEQKELANENGGLNVESKWYSDEDYRRMIEATFGKESGDGEAYNYTLDDIEAMRQYVEAHGIGNSKEADALSKFADQFMGSAYRRR